MSVTSTSPPAAGTTGGAERRTTVRSTNVVPAPLDRLPLFGRGGTLVPLAIVDDDGMVDDDLLTLRVFPGEGAGSIYDDDGETFEYRRGAFALRRYRVRTDGDETVVSLTGVEGGYAKRRRLVFETPEGASAEVVDTGDPVDVAFRSHL